MKSTLIILSICLLTLTKLSAQQCVIKCQEYNPGNKNKLIGVPFALVIKDGKKEISLSSNQNGVLIVSKAVYAKYMSKIIQSFVFLNPADHEYYGTPYQLYNKKKKLSDICGLTLTVDRIW